MSNTELLSDIFYDPKLGLLSYAKFRAKIKELHPDITTNEIKSFYENQEINQLAKNQYLRKPRCIKLQVLNYPFK